MNSATDDQNNRSSIADGVRLGSLVMHGSDNELLVADGAKTHDLQINFHGNGCVLHIGPNSHVRGQVHMLGSNNKLLIGRNLRCNSNIFINMSESENVISIGDDCLFANPRFRVSDSHQIFDIDSGERLNPSGNIIVEDRVWIAEDVLLLKNAHVGSGSVVGAKSLVNCPLPPDCLAVGTPARVVRQNIRWK